MAKKDYRKFFKNLHVNIKDHNIELSINIDNKKLFGERLNYAQDKWDRQAWHDIQTYMPFDSGALIGETNALQDFGSGELYLYPPNHDYGHYLYEGKVYVDPKTGKGSFYTPTYGHWSRPGVGKVPSDRNLKFKKHLAVHHWGEAATKYCMKKWALQVERWLNK